MPESRPGLAENARADGNRWGKWKRRNPTGGEPEIPLGYQGGAVADAWRAGYRAGLLGKK